MSLNNSILGHGSNADIASLVNRYLLFMGRRSMQFQNHGRLLVSKSYSHPSHSLRVRSLHTPLGLDHGPRGLWHLSRRTRRLPLVTDSFSLPRSSLLSPPACYPRREGLREGGGYTGWWVAYGRGRLF